MHGLKERARRKREIPVGGERSLHTFVRQQMRAEKS